MPEPRQGETRDSFVSRCIPIVIRDGTARDQSQATAICHSVYGRNNMRMLCLNFKANNYTTRTENWQGRTHIVAPVAMLAEGVFTGLDGIPTYYPADVLQQMPHSWNGMPITIDHPRDERGNTVSARSPEAMNRHSAGHLFNVFCDGKLRGELWIDVDRVQQIYPALLEMLKSQREIEVSTGLFPNEEIVSGEFNGREYARIMRGITPDHLALLPESEGACNFDDGCGVRINEEGGDKVEFKGINFDSLSVKLHNEGNLVAVDDEGALPFDLRSYLNFEKIEKIEGLEQSFEEVRYALQRYVDGLDNPTHIHYVQAVYNDDFVYEASAQIPRGDTKLYRQGYKIGNDGSVELSGDPVEVRQKTEYVPITNEIVDSESATNKEGGNSMEKCCPEKVEALIQNETSPHGEDDREWLESQEESQIDKLIAMSEAQEGATVNDGGEEPGEEGQVVTDQPGEGETETPDTPEEFIANAPGEMQEVLQSGLTLHRKKKADLITSLMKVEGNKFTKEQLENKDVEELENLVSLAKVNVDYSGMGGSQGRPVSEPMPLTEQHGAV